MVQILFLPLLLQQAAEKRQAPQQVQAVEAVAVVQMLAIQRRSVAQGQAGKATRVALQHLVA